MIDILLPFYGDPGLMRQAVHSVLAQTQGDFRLVVVDDGYPDRSVPRWFEELEDERVEYHRNARNLGANQNYTRALDLARADHVVVMGADDIMLPNYIEMLHRVLEKYPDASIVACGVEVIDEHGGAIRPPVDRAKQWLRPRTIQDRVMRDEDALVSVLRGNWTYFPSLCWKREQITELGFRPEFNVVQDLGLVVDVLARAGSLVVSPEIAFQYRRHAGSDSSLKTVAGGRFREEKQFFELVAGELEQHGMGRAARAARRHLTSRLHAASLIPRAVRGRDWAGVHALARHAAI